MGTQLPIAFVARAAQIRANLMRDSNGEEDLSLATIAIKLKDATVAARNAEVANLAPSFAKTQALHPQT